MRIRIYEFPLQNPRSNLRTDKPRELGYIEVKDEEINKYNANECWHICNWSNWSKVKPSCLQSDIVYCTHGIVFVYPGLQAEVHCLALSDGWLVGTEEEVQKYATEHVNDPVWAETTVSMDYEPPKYQEIKVGRVYKHFKGKLYLVLDIAEGSEDGECYVVYKALYGNCKTYIRPFYMFASLVERDKYPTVTQQYRFELVEE